MAALSAYYFAMRAPPISATIHFQLQASARPRDAASRSTPFMRRARRAEAIRQLDDDDYIARRFSGTSAEAITCAACRASFALSISPLFH